MSRRRTLALIGLGALIILMGPSRIDEGEHWFGDGAAGYLPGCICLIDAMAARSAGKKSQASARGGNRNKAVSSRIP